MKVSVFVWAYFAAALFLSAVGTFACGGLLTLGGMLHGEPIGGAWGILSAPLVGALGAFGLMLVFGVPVGLLVQGLFWHGRWPRWIRWVFIPLTGPAFFVVLAPLFLLLGGPEDLFSASACSFVLGCVVSTYWLAYLICEAVSRRPTERIPERRSCPR